MTWRSIVAAIVWVSFVFVLAGFAQRWMFGWELRNWHYDGRAVVGSDSAVRPDKADAFMCMANAYLRKLDPASPYLPENGWKGDQWTCPDEPKR